MQKIHEYLFSDIYDFAGKVRSVNIAKNNFCFAPLMYLENSLSSIDNMLQSTFDEIIEKSSLSCDTKRKLLFAAAGGGKTVKWMRMKCCEASKQTSIM